jgi:hypothetical protein
MGKEGEGEGNDISSPFPLPRILFLPEMSIMGILYFFSIQGE